MPSEPLRIIFFSEAGSPFGKRHFASLCTIPDIKMLGVVISRKNTQGACSLPGATRRDRFRNALWRGIHTVAGVAPGIDLTAFNMITEAWIRSIPVFSGRRNKHPQFIDRIKALQPDVLISAGHQKILPETVLDIPRIAAVNFHPSLLPEGRGRNPCFWTIVTGQKETGVTAHHMVAGADQGDILIQKSIPLTGEETYSSLYDRLTGLSVEMIPETLDLCRTGSPPRIPQPEGEWPMYGEPAEQDYHIRWSDDAETIERLIRAGMDHPGAFMHIMGERIVVCEVRVEDSIDASPGTILEISEHCVCVATGDGRLWLERMRTEDDTSSAVDIARGFGLKPGDRLE